MLKPKENLLSRKMRLMLLKEILRQYYRGSKYIV